VIVVFDEGLDLGLEVAGQEVVFQQDAVLHGLVPVPRQHQWHRFEVVI
jgi:hypothetical protein